MLIPSEPTAHGAPKIYRDILDRAERELKEQCNLIRQIIPHNGEKGGQIERTFQAALRRVLSPRIGVGAGFVVDSQGKSSKQLDIILYDRDGTPAIFADGELLVLPAECVYAAGEVKTYLGRREIEDSLAKCRSFKSLAREAQFIQSGVISKKFGFYGEQLECWPAIFFVASLSANTIDKFHQNFLELINIKGGTVFGRHGLDVVCSLDGNMKVNATAKKVDGVIVSADDIENVRLCAEPGQEWMTYHSASPWVLLVSLLNTVMTQAPPTNVNMIKYLNNKPL